MKIENEMSDEFFDWLDECPVMWHLNSSDGNSMVYSFLVTKEDEAFQRNEEAYQKDYIKHGRAE